MVVLFDVNGTLLDTRALGPTLRRSFAGNISVEGFFTRLLQYSMATTMAGHYRDFSELASATLEMCAAAQGFRLTTAQTKSVLARMRRLPPFTDVKPGLRRLQQAGYRLATLTNSSTAALQEQLQNSRLAPYFEQAISVDSVRKYKPSPETYIYAAKSLGVEIHEILMVAAHPWDLLGAAAVGCRTAFLTRPGRAQFPEAPHPTHVASDLLNLAGQLDGTAAPPKPKHLMTQGDYAVLGSSALALGVASVLLPALKANGRQD